MGEKVLSRGTIEKFRRAEVTLRKQGWITANPASDEFQRQACQTVSAQMSRWGELEHPTFSWYSWMLQYDIRALLMCDAVYMLSDWQDSPGATAELFFARACGKEVIFDPVSNPAEDLRPKAGESVTEYVHRLASVSAMTQEQRKVAEAIGKYSYIRGAKEISDIYNINEDIDL